MIGKSAKDCSEYQAGNCGEKLSDIEVAWLAGIFEGEGSIYMGARSQRTTTIVMVDEDVIHRVQKLFPAPRGIWRQEGRYEGWQPTFRWRLSRTTDVTTFLTLILPHMGLRCSAKIKEVLLNL